MIYGISDAFARVAQVPPASHTPPYMKESVEERRNSLIKHGFPPNSLSIQAGQLMLVSSESDRMEML